MCLVAALIALAQPSLAPAQTTPLGRLGPWINLDDQIRVTGADGEQVTGRLVGLTHDDLVVRTPAGQRRFSADVRAIAVRRRPLRTPILVGAGAGVAAGVAAACTGSDRSECADGPLILGALGAGVGAVYGLVRARWQAVPPVAAGRETMPAWQPGPLDELALRVNVGDRVQVTDESGIRSNGRVVRLTGRELGLETTQGDVSLSAGRVREVRVRRYPMRIGALVGAAAMTIALAASPHCRSEDSDCQPLAALPIGAGVGGAVGALIPRMAPVFRASQAQAAVVPVVGRGRYGVGASLRW